MSGSSTLLALGIMGMVERGGEAKDGRNDCDRLRCVEECCCDFSAKIVSCSCLTSLHKWSSSLGCCKGVTLAIYGRCKWW